MSMFQVSGQVMNVFETVDRTNKESGEIEKGKPKVQIMGDIPLPNGETRFDLITLTVLSKSAYQGLLGKQIRVPLGFFSPSKGNIVYFIPQGGKPEVVSA